MQPETDVSPPVSPRVRVVAVLAVIVSAWIYYSMMGMNALEMQRILELEQARYGEDNKEKPRPTFMNLREGQEHVLVTGGAGYIGSHAVMALMKMGYFVTIIDNLSRGNRGAVHTLLWYAQTLRKGKPGIPLRFVEGDLGDRNAVQDAFRNGPNVDIVMHFAAVAYVGESVAEPLAYYRNISINSVVLLEEMRVSNVNRLVFSSTCATYGSPAAKDLPVTEMTPTNPMSPYGHAKLWVEQIIKDYSISNPSFKVGMLRYFNVYGCDPDGLLGEWPRPALQKKHGRITNAALDAAQGTIPSVKILGTGHPTPDGTAIRDFIHVSDLVDAHISLIPKITNPPVLYNVGTGSGVSVREIVNAAIKVTGVNFTVVEQKNGRPGDSPEIYANPKKIKTELNWNPRYTDVHDGLRHCWNWRQAHPNGY